MTRLENYCSLYQLVDCKISVRLAESFLYGEPISNVAMCDSFTNQEVNEIKANTSGPASAERLFYDLYLNLTWVRVREDFENK